MTVPRRTFVLTAVLLGAAAVVATRPQSTAGPARVLFVGNSLTATHDVPELVAALARADGQALEGHAVTGPNLSLEDHWQEGTARRVIALGGWSTVVLQQGPSALPESRVLLREYVRRFDGEVRRAGARTALYMVWPSRSRAFDFGDVSASYTAAAREVNGLLLPVGDAWREAWRLDPAMTLYGPDGFHPSVDGAYLAALVIYGGLTGRSPVDLPATVAIGPDAATSVTVEPSVAALLQRAAAAVLQRAP